VRAGEAATATIQVTADGATTAQLPELQLASEDGAQVFADAPQSDDTFSEGRPQVRLTRKFSVVPARAGTLRIPGPRLRWWDVRAGMARSASLPDLVLQVAPGVTGTGVGSNAAAPKTARDPDGGDVRIPGVQQPVQRWALATASFAVLWLVTLAWALQRRTAHPREAVAYDAEIPAGAKATLADLKRGLEHGDLSEVADVLCALCVPPAPGLDALRPLLGEPRQVAAIDLLQRARWGGGDGVVARSALRDAFKSGPKWKAQPKAASPDPLPPLYPPG